MSSRKYRPLLSTASSTRAIKNLFARMTRSWYLKLSPQDSSFYLTFLRHQLMQILIGINGPRHKLMQYETNLINLQISMEESFKSFLVSDGDGSSDAGVLICDRGVQLLKKSFIPCMFCSDLLLVCYCNMSTVQQLSVKGCVIWSNPQGGIKGFHTALIYRTKKIRKYVNTIY